MSQSLFVLMRRHLPLLLLLGVLSCKSGGEAAVAPAPPVMPPTSTATFTNPLLASGPDPWVYQKDGYYYYMHTTNTNLRIWKTANMSDLSQTSSVVAWTPPVTGPASGNLWAPELYFLDGKWYIYYSAGPEGTNLGQQRTWVLENTSADPTAGSWVDKGRLYNSTADYWAIDGTVLEQNGNRYFIWSGHNGIDAIQRLYISQMSNPWTLTGPRVELSHPEYSWENVGPPFVNEGPETIKHGGKTFLVYSASFCGTDQYALGLLTASTTADPMLPASWTKSAQPVFSQSPANRAYATGHNAFFKSKDGQEDWIIYHANSNPSEGCVEKRNPRMQKFTWNADGTPSFGVPVAISTPIAKPGGE
ncbi:glycoside hydrolase family 43 protein [Hymenobacter sp. BT770]|uniref:glycoside hydrolase family 43 protein n=1 Tax=Hymenobacter sp. BT770 TaxID=2886942 RepID=UPI001D0F7EF9|nr:glycoside hydrolase family 43 protein [Hymenobacter sp. BT770]MCC3154412.1 glycoside hydrolase family 43 protein [Hymenobacter sp. BT770]MDO3416283.1 glycoside hydrolase family 43 protein [Hymenobacter sp. BT770]